MAVFGVIFFTLLLLGAPIFVSLGLPAVISLAAAGKLSVVPSVVWGSLDKPDLSAVPFFILMGHLMDRSSGVDRLFVLMKTFVGHWTGGLAVATILGSMFFAAISGTSTGNAAAMTLMMLPAMTEARYDRGFAAGLIAAGGTLGILIPPSVMFILFAAITEQSVPRLFMAGVVPGILLGLALMATAVLLSWRRGYGRTARAPWSERGKAFVRAIPVLAMPLVVLGGIYGGFMAPTESAIAGVVYATGLGLAYRELTWRGVREALVATIKSTTMIFMIIATAALFANVLVYDLVPQTIARAVVSHLDSTVLFLLATAVLLTLMGDFLDVTAILFITVPILYPIALGLHIDPLAFAVFFVMFMELGLITPPVGLNLFVVSGTSGMSLHEVMKGTVPFMFVIPAVAIVVAFSPWLVTWLPSLLMP